MLCAICSIRACETWTRQLPATRSAGLYRAYLPVIISLPPLITWGLFRRDGSFIPVAGTPEPETVARLFQHKVLQMLLEEGAIDEHVVADVLAGATRDSEPT